MNNREAWKRMLTYLFSRARFVPNAEPQSTGGLNQRFKGVWRRKPLKEKFRVKGDAIEGTEAAERPDPATMADRVAENVSA
ncbi:MAG: hypothetical protein PHG47_10345 [Sulfuricella sp.]|nr:hypothetical protein [Sulfuricella sp.]